MDNLEKRLENLNLPKIPELKDQQQVKLSILNARKSARIGLFMLAIPFLILAGAFIETLFKVAIPPWSWLKAVNPSLPVWMRVSIFVIIVIILPLTALVINILSITWFNYDKKQKVFSVSVKFKTVNLIIIAIAKVLALLFIGHAIADWIAGHD